MLLLLPSPREATANTAWNARRVPGNFRFNVWTAASFARYRKSDGRLVWKLSHSFGGTRSGDTPSRRFLSELTRAAGELRFNPRARHDRTV